MSPERREEITKEIQLLVETNIHSVKKLAASEFNDYLNYMEETVKKEHIPVLFGEMLEMIRHKGKAYAGTDDSLANFKRNAERLSLSPFQIWAVYFNKHIDSINNAIGQNPTAPKDKTEGMHGRIIDAMTYLSILHCLLEEYDLLT